MPAPNRPVSSLRKLGLAIALMAAAPLAARAADAPIDACFVYSGPVGDGGWTYQHDLARQSVDKAFAGRVRTRYVENVPESSDAERVIRQFAQDGCKIVFTTSFGFMEPALKVAKQFPNVKFEHATGYKMASNVGIYQTRFYEGAYLLGVLAGSKTKSNTLGYIGSIPIPEVLRNLDAYTLGARSVNPAIKVKVVWVNGWYNPGLERQAAETLVAQGADVLYQNTDSPAAVQVAEAKGIHAFGQDSDMSRYGKRAHMSANTVNWGVYYRHKIQQLLDGKWAPEDTKWGMKEGMIELSPLNAEVPPALAKTFEDKRKAIVDGRLLPFAGPIRDQTGKEVVAAGAVLPEAGLWSLKWLVEGIDTPLPQ
ncbi:BMP family ABC transporter substrate-binding protein [Derxia lacustris]|uniref:BMP family ABC transporter substrate-binding protein n=1 Tax=Derxia lacustris TaxID=764842 RepID=UPI000A16D8E3|nr:BMP family ABC transporter substrate-binding protein [Derxia lacustris]